MTPTIIPMEMESAIAMDLPNFLVRYVTNIEVTSTIPIPRINLIIDVFFFQNSNKIVDGRKNYKANNKFQSRIKGHEISKSLNKK